MRALWSRRALSSTPNQPAASMAVWVRHTRINCYWDGHGAKEVDARGTAVLER